MSKRKTPKRNPAMNNSSKFIQIMGDLYDSLGGVGSFRLSEVFVQLKGPKYKKADFESDLASVNQLGVTDSKGRRIWLHPASLMNGKKDFHINDRSGGRLVVTFSMGLPKKNPIRRLERIGDWTKNHGFDEQDRKLLTSENHIRRILDAWQKTPYIFDIYVVNTAKSNKAGFREKGIVPSDWLQEKTGINIKPSEGAITLVYTGNYGVEKIPMTSWILAHRAAHAIRLTGGDLRGSVYYEKLRFAFERCFDTIIRYFQLPEIYPYANLTKYPDKSGSVFTKATELRYYKYLSFQVGTTAACRNHNLRNFYELLYECVAQFIITGKVKLNKLSNTVTWGPAPFGRKFKKTIDNSTLMEVNILLQDLQDELNEILIPEFLNSAVGNLYLM